MACPLAAERVWTEKAQYHDAEKKYFENLSKVIFCILPVSAIVSFYIT